MLDLKLWSKFYWENEYINWRNLSADLERRDPKEYAIEISEKIKKINNDYFNECAENSVSYYPSIEIDKKVKKLKRALGDKNRLIPLKEWIIELNKTKEKGVLFFHYLSKNLTIKEKPQIIKMLNNYNSIIMTYFKNEIINSDINDKIKEKNINTLSQELERVAEGLTIKSYKFIVNFLNKEEKEEWFKNNLSEIVRFGVFLYYIAYMIEESKEDIIEWSNFLKTNASEKSLIDLNAEMLSHLYIFDDLNRFEVLSRSLPIDDYIAFKKLVFSQLDDPIHLEKWYNNVVRDEKNPRLFFDRIWLEKEKGMRLVTEIDSDSNILNFIANKMSIIYSNEEIKHFNFTNSLIVNNNIQEIMSKKYHYYYLENKLTNNNKIKTKGIKI